ncbi:hypothetical protein [Roseibium sp.]|uniref:hypothetical protein n=1 Tax=Roseibium sp. TaxID=1936156 RepID=UPI003B5240DF
MLKKISFASGIDKDDTTLTREGGYVDGDWVRFWRGKWQVKGGWEAITNDTFTGYARGAHSWQDNNSNKVFAWGTPTKLYAYIGGAILDITPNKAEGTLENPFTTENGSDVVEVEHDQHGLLVDDNITFSHAVAVGGITIDGAYTVTEVLTPNKYTITHSSSATSTVSSGGGYVDFVATLEAGLTDGEGGSGYGTSTYGSGTYGSASAGDFFPRTWTLDNWGENLMACPRGGAVFEWQPALSYSDIIEDGAFDSGTDWTQGTGWSVGSGVATKTAGTASNLSQDIESEAEGGKTYRLTFDATFTAGEIQIGVNAGYTTPAIVDIGLPLDQSGSYSRLITLPAEPLDLVFQADSAMAGTIDNVTFSLEDDAYRIDTAPAHNVGLLVSSDRTVVTYGTVNSDGEYDPLLVRWSDRENNRSWIPGGSSIAGSLPMSIGGQAITGLSSREQNLIWTDSGVHALIPSNGSTAYTLPLLGEGCGAIGPLAVTSHSGRVFWVTGDGVPYTLQSSVSDVGISQPMPIESGVRQDFYDNITINQQEKIQCWINPRFTEFWTLYPDQRDGVEVSRYQAFNWVESHWSVGTIDRTTVISSGTEDFPVGFGTDNKIYYHEKGTSANGDVLSAYIVSGDFDVGDGENLMHIRRMIPDFKNQSATVTTTLYSRPWAQGSQTTHGPYSFLTSTLKKDMRATGRHFSVRYDISAFDARCREGTLAFDVQETGQKR